MNGRSLFILGLAVLIGLGAMLMSRKMLASGASKEEETRDVLVAARDIKEEEPLKADMVKVVRMAKSAVPANAYSSFKEVEERWIKTTMLEGDIVVEKKLGPKGTPPGLVANIPKGMRAFAIEVTEQSGVSGFILPGHRVDVVLSDSSDQNSHRAESVLQNVLVLASGRVFNRADERSVQSRTVTLALRPPEVDVLVVARARGTLSLALRGVNDHDVVAQRPPKPAVDPEHEKRLKLEEEKRIKLEQELHQLKAALAEKTAQPAATVAPKKSTRVATIYRGPQNLQRVHTEHQPAAEMESPDLAALSDFEAGRGNVAFRPATGRRDTAAPTP